MKRKKQKPVYTPFMHRHLRKRMNQLRKRMSFPEQMMYECLMSIGLRFIWQKGFLCKGKAIRIVDFYLPDLNIIIEVDGPEHDKEADDLREQQIKLEKPTYTFLRFTNKKVLETPNFQAFLSSKIYNFARKDETGGTGMRDFGVEISTSSS